MSLIFQSKNHHDEDSDHDSQCETTTQHTLNFSETCLNHDQDSFPESLYDRIEDFLDNERLFFSTKSPILTQTTLKPSVTLKKMNSLILKSESGIIIKKTLSDKTDETAKTMPSFLFRRAFSAEVQENI